MLYEMIRHIGYWKFTPKTKWLCRKLHMFNIDEITNKGTKIWGDIPKYIVYPLIPWSLNEK